MNDDQRLLASAALDGDVTTEERARAEADPAVVAEIERLRAVRTAIRVEVAPDPSRREAAIAAALGAFDARATVTAPPSPSPAARRRNRWLTPVLAAAAAVIVVVGGVVTIRSGERDGDDAATSATAFDESPAELSATGRESPAATVAAAADEGSGAESEAESEAETEAAEATVASDAGDAALPAAPAEPLTSPADITEYVGSGGESDSADVAVCPGGVLVGRTSYVVDGVAVPVEVLRVDDLGEAIAVRVDTCDVVARAPLP